jgi:hypothetical protein
MPQPTELTDVSDEQKSGQDSAEDLAGQRLLADAMKPEPMRTGDTVPGSPAQGGLPALELFSGEQKLKPSSKPTERKNDDPFDNIPQSKVEAHRSPQGDKYSVEISGVSKRISAIERPDGSMTTVTRDAKGEPDFITQTHPLKDGRTAIESWQRGATDAQGRTPWVNATTRETRYNMKVQEQGELKGTIHWKDGKTGRDEVQFPWSSNDPAKLKPLVKVPENILPAEKRGDREINGEIYHNGDPKFVPAENYKSRPDAPKPNGEALDPSDRGTLTNKTDKPILYIANQIENGNKGANRIYVLKPGETTPPNVDVDGIVKDKRFQPIVTNDGQILVPDHIPPDVDCVKIRDGVKADAVGTKEGDVTIGGYVTQRADGSLRNIGANVRLIDNVEDVKADEFGGVWKTGSWGSRVTHHGGIGPERKK